MRVKNIFFGVLSSLIIISCAHAAEIDMNMAQMQAMDKITGRVSLIEVPVGGNVTFGTFSIVVRSCKTKTEEEVPENFAFVDVTDKSFNNEEYNIFKGWMLSSSPAVNAVEHPIYDVWLIKCFNGDVKKEMLLSQEQLDARDNLPRLNEVQTQNQALMSNSLIDDEPQNISFKEAIYKEEILPEVQNKAVEKVEGEPQNLIHIDETFEVDEEMVQLPSQDLQKALKEQQQKLDFNQTDIETLENRVQSTIDEDLTAAINEELKNMD
ncbi:MAG: DUF2155 domain-containing protein [Alphaproteobacteria bacterium]|nr:DUF2155 domain-containing protein [Alphaproteobacteria bacterium]